MWKRCANWARWIDSRVRLCLPDPHPMGEGGSESSRNLEWDLIQRVLARLWIFLRGLRWSHTLDSRREDFLNRAHNARWIRSRSSLLAEPRRPPRPSGEGLDHTLLPHRGDLGVGITD